jgi:hypothetical protein
MAVIQAPPISTPTYKGPNPADPVPGKHFDPLKGTWVANTPAATTNSGSPPTNANGSPRTAASMGGDVADFWKAASAGFPSNTYNPEPNVAMGGLFNAGGYGMQGSQYAAAPDLNYNASASMGPTLAREGGNTAPMARETLNPADTTAKNAALFGAAKDQVGQETRGALTGLAGAMAGRGIVGSGVEGRGQLGVINQGQQQLGATTRQNAVTDAELAQRNAEMAYQGSITQRGQDIGQQTAQTGFDVTQRGQDISSQQQSAQNALQAALAQYGGGITQRGQNIGIGEGGQDRALQALMAQYSGGVTQRGQNITGQLGVGQLNQQQIQNLIAMLQSTSNSY